MKTFNELILWELQQEGKQNSSGLSVSEEQSGGKLSASVMRKLRYLKSAPATPKRYPEGFNPA